MKGEPDVQKMFEEFEIKAACQPPCVATNLRAWMQDTKRIIREVYDTTGIWMPIEFVKAVFLYRHPVLRYELIKDMSEVLVTPKAYEIYQQFFNEERSPQYKRFPSLILAYMHYRGIPCQEFVNSLPRYTDEGKQSSLFLDTLHLLCRENTLMTKDLENLVELMRKTLLEGPQKQKWAKLLELCLNIQILIKNGMVSKLTQEFIQHHENNIPHIIEEAFLELFPYFREKATGVWASNDTSARFCQARALLFYRSELQKLPDSDRVRCLQALDSFVQSVLEHQFLEKRYDVSQSPHLKKVFEDPSFARAWKEGSQKLLTSKLEGQTLTIQSFKEWILKDSDDPCDLFLSGTEVLGSLHNITGDSSLSKCLLGYLLNGENRLLEVTDAKGKIRARRVFKVLWDDVKKVPVLFVEKVYTSGYVPQEALQALDVFAQERASALHLSLLTVDAGFLPYGNPVKALGGPAPYGYSDDSSNGVHPRGAFTIENPLLWTEHK